MRILLINQTFYPDLVATSQYLTQLAVALADRGHQATVITSRRGYDAPERKFPSAETWRGIQIIRVNATALGKTAKWRRAFDFGSFLSAAAGRLCRLPRQDVILALTSPPLVSVLGAFFARLRFGRFYYWIMDFNPDEAIAAGWLRRGSFAAGVLERASMFSLERAAGIIALDRFMRQRIISKGLPPAKVTVLPPWSHDGDVRFDAAERERFRNAHGFQDKFVVMYSGNHSPCHPLDTLLNAAASLRERQDILFCFVGGGSEYARVVDLERSLPAGRRNIQCLPYQTAENLSACLSAADLQTVIMGEPFVGLIHPCKIYNILAIGAPVLCITPQPSHLADLCDQLGPHYERAVLPHDNVDAVVHFILRLQARGSTTHHPITDAEFSRDKVLPKLIHLLEGVPSQVPAASALSA